MMDVLPPRLRVANSSWGRGARALGGPRTSVVLDVLTHGVRGVFSDIWLRKYRFWGIMDCRVHKIGSSGSVCSLEPRHSLEVAVEIH